MKNTFKIKHIRRYCSLVLALCIGMSLYIPVAADEIKQETEDIQEISMEGKPRLNYTEITEDGRVAENIQLQGLVEEYFTLREEAMEGKIKETTIMRRASVLAEDEDVLQKEIARIEGIDNLATYHGVYVREWTNHIYIENEETVPATGEETLNLSVYEWNWIVYDDGRGGPKDEMGFATLHEMTLKKDTEGQYRIVADVYDESDILGKKEKTFDEIAHEAEEERTEKVIMVQEEMKTFRNDFPSAVVLSESENTNTKKTANYHPVDAITYADQWVNHDANGGYCGNYNPYYPSFENTSDSNGGNDCANYVSQCLKAGGMINDKYSASIGWWYDSVTKESSKSWRGTLSMEKYWVNEKGYAKVEASMTKVLPGNPVYSADNGHVGICVGYSAGGVPIINAHTNDVYHVPYTTWVKSTIQIVENNTGRPRPTNITEITVTTSDQTIDVNIPANGWIYLRFYTDGKSNFVFRGDGKTDKFASSICVYQERSATDSGIYMYEIDRVDGSKSTYETQLTMKKPPIGLYYIRIQGNGIYRSGKITLHYSKK